MQLERSHIFLKKPCSNGESSTSNCSVLELEGSPLHIL